MKKAISILLAVMFLFSSLSIFACAASFDVTREVGNGENFVKNYYFDSNKGIISASFNKKIFDEAAIKVLHTEKTHYGTVTFGSRVDTTNVASATNWTNMADVRVDSRGNAVYAAVYY